MNSSWLVLFMVAAIFVSMILLAVVCLDCRTNGPPVSISQGNASDEYMPSTNFRVIHPYQQSIDMNSIHPSSNLLSPFSPSTDPGTQRRHRSFTPTETGEILIFSLLLFPQLCALYRNVGLTCYFFLTYRK
ncbi:uncharacterized protein LKV04_018445 [Tautogolabrus adspersus]